MLALEFLGQTEPPLQSATEWLASRFGGELDGVIVALPGARAGRRLAEHLARRMGPAWSPPSIVTAGLLTDNLLRVDGIPAGRMARTLAWARALRQLDPRTLARLTPGARRSESRESMGSWLGLAERVRGLHGELAAEGQDFAAATAATLSMDAQAESLRWQTLEEVQRNMELALAEVERVDPHLARRRAIEAGALLEPRAVVLVGVSDMNGLLRQTLEVLAAPVHALVFAPEERREDFDALGCLLPAAIIERGIELPLESWSVAGTPDDQAARAVSTLAAYGGRYRAEQITLGAADSEVVPFLTRRLESAGVRVRDAAGTNLLLTLPARLLRASADFLARRRFSDYATLLRHPDFRPLPGQAGVAIALLDEYQEKHLPDAIPTDPERGWLGRHRAVLGALQTAVLEAFGDLATSESRPLASWGGAIRDFLLGVYGGWTLDPAQAAERERAEALRSIAKVLGELEELAPGLSLEAKPEEAIEFVLRNLATQALAPAAARPGEPTIEMLGWLELALDDAPALVVTGFQDGLVPETISGDAFLPDGLRQRLGLLDNPRRLARDLFATELLLASRKEVLFISGRWSRMGDPTLPSRIVFHVPPGREEQVLDRVEHLLAEEGEPATRAAEPASQARELPRGPIETLETISVTSFRTYLESPYRYYLERSRRLQAVEDEAREMNGLLFGDLAHRVLEDFGKRATVKDSQDPRAIAAFLRDRLRVRSEERFTARPLPAVALQLAQLEHRLDRFAVAQAERAQAGWRIAHVEWAPEDGGAVTRVVDGEGVRIRGRIDRIDVHADGRWAVWDYKTGDRVPKPASAHRRRDGSWVDLQLPLYCLLAMELGFEVQPELGYIGIAKDRSAFETASKWDADVLAEALEAADDVIRAIRAGDLWRIGRWQPKPEAFRALCGVDLVAGGLAEEDPEDAENSEASE